MRSVTYKSVIDRIASYMGEADDLDVEDAALANQKINFFVRLGWHFYWFPETMETERRTFRPTYAAGTAYAAPTATSASEVFFPADKNYYQALRATTGNAPATLTGGSYEPNDAYWALCSGSYSGDDWAASTVYVVAAIVRNPDNDRYYQCHTAHTSAGSFDATKFGILTPFVRSIAYEQTGSTSLGLVRYPWDSDPETNLTARPMPFITRRDYIVVRGCANVIYLEFQTRAPLFAGSTRTATDTYSADETVYDIATGDFWTANQSVAAGESPTTNPEKWDKVEFPYFLAEYAAQSAYAMMTNREQEEPENFSIQLAAGFPLLQAEVDHIERKQGQVRQLNVVTGRR